MNFKNISLTVLFFFFINISFSQKASDDEINKVVENFIQLKNKKELLLQKPKVIKIKNEKTGEALFNVYNFPNAFIVVSASKNNIPVKAFSFNHSLKVNFNDNEIHLTDVLKEDYIEFNKFLKNKSYVQKQNLQKWENLLDKASLKNTNDITYGPFLSSLYGQVNCHDNNGHLVNVTNYYTPNHYAVGCVAMTFTEVMRYYNWPRKGVGSYSYTDSYGNSTGSYSANFEEKYYNWDIIPDRYDGVASTDQQRSELGKVAFHAAVSVSMDFENGGSTSNINRIPNAASKYFRYTADYKEKTASDFWSVLDTSLHHSVPTQFAVYTDGGAGHAVVGDGIQYIGNEKYYHLNMGWWGDDNGWYQIHQSFNAGGYTNVTAAVLNMIPVPEIDESPELDVENKTVKLEWYYSNKIQAENYELQVKKGPAEWETVTDTLTQKTYTFQADKENDYSFRVRAKINGKWKDNGWSNELKIIPSDFKVAGDEELTLYPTVVYDNLKISYKNLSGSYLKIYNLKGDLVYNNTETISDNEININVRGFETGFYIVQISNETERKSAKFLKL